MIQPCILVTGDLGYIGTHLVSVLKSRGYNVVGFDLKRGEDIRDKSQIEQIFNNNRISLVIHLAALIDVGQSEWDKMKYYQTNLVGTINLLDVMESYGCESIVFASTAAVYKTKNTPLVEGDVTDPSSIYGHTKLLAEEIIKRTCPKYIIFRFFNVAGTNTSVSRADRHSHLIPSIIRQYKNGNPVYIFGNDYQTADGTCVRDYVHVDDIVAAIVKVIDCQGLNTVINLGTSSGLSVKRVVNGLDQAVGYQLKVKTAGRRPGDTDTLVASPGRAERLLDWHCQKDIDDMIDSTFKAW